MIVLHATVWTLYASVVANIARLAYRDWHDPEEDRVVVAVTAGAFMVLLAVVGVVLAVTL